ncbi:MAG: helix-turn-helix domain-containing protein [Flavobacteriaceae bacterium]
MNLHIEMKFQDFVNSYRIEEFRRRIASQKYRHYTIFGIATEVGFNSKSTFNNAFKKFVGITPQEYKWEISQKGELGTN